MVNITVSNGRMMVSSEYDTLIVSFMRSRPIRTWNKDSKLWILPQSDLNLFLQAIDGYEYSVQYLDNTVPDKSVEFAELPDWYEFKTKPYAHQIDGVRYGLKHNKFLLADEQGCIDGDMLVSYNFGGASATAKLSDLYKKYQKSSVKSKFKVRCLKDGVFGLNGVQDILYSGKKDVYEVMLECGKFVIATKDHLILTNHGYTRVDELQIGDTVMTNGEVQCCPNSDDNAVAMIPKESMVKSIKYVGVKDTYDIVMRDPYRNFIANKIVVHNCGKTKTMLDLSQIYKQQNNFKHVLIVACVNGLKYNWQNEVETHTNDTGYILGTRRTKKGTYRIGGNPDRLEDIESLDENETIAESYYLITNIETLRYSKTIERTTRNGKIKKETVFPIIEALQRQIDNGNISMIIVDEMHKVKDSNSQIGKALLSLNCDYKVALTGTPVMNNPVDLYSILYFIGMEDHSSFAFKKHYCIFGGYGNHQIVGYKNLPELQSSLDKCMLRRLKSDVLDLPDKIYINEFVEMSSDQESIYNEVLSNLIKDIDRIRLSPNPLTMLIRLRQATGNPSILSSKKIQNPKFDRMIELIDEVVQSGKKCIVFSNWTDVLVPAYELAKAHKFNPALYTGDNTDVRESEKDRFKSDKSCKVMFGTIGAMGTGLTLTEATTAIFLDEPWNRALKDQCEDRIHRIGTSESPNIITIMCKGTIDERINAIVYRKGKLSDIIVDKEEDIFKNPKLVDYLLSI